jgi:hypothetical protein
LQLLLLKGEALVGYAVPVLKEQVWSARKGHALRLRNLAEHLQVGTQAQVLHHAREAFEASGANLQPPIHAPLQK